VESGESGGFSFVANIPSANQLGKEDKVVNCRGKLIVEHKKVLIVDEEEILAQTRAGAEKLWRRLL